MMKENKDDELKDGNVFNFAARILGLQDSFDLSDQSGNLLDTYIKMSSINNNNEFHRDYIMWSILIVTTI